MASFIRILKHADIFYKLSASQLDLVSAVCAEQSFKTGDIILEENSASDELYIIAEGEVEILVNPALVSDQPDIVRDLVTIATLRRGQSFGEIALVDRGLRSAAVRASQNNTRLLVIPRDRLMQLCDTYPNLGYRLMRNLAADLALKIRTTDLRIRETLLYGSEKR
jgi:CRP-like cAMP-binding protein